MKRTKKFNESGESDDVAIYIADKIRKTLNKYVGGWIDDMEWYGDNQFLVKTYLGNFKVKVEPDEKALSESTEDVPNDEYMIELENGRKVHVYLSYEDDWGNIQPCIPSDCEDWRTSIGWGDDANGHVKIVRVVDCETNESVGSVYRWYEQVVTKFMDLYT